MPSKKEKQQQQAALLAMKAQAATTTPLANSTNTISTVPLTNSYQTVTTTTKKTTSSTVDSIDHASLIREQKNELDELNNRFSNYVLALRKKSEENNDLQKHVDTEKQKQSSIKTLTSVRSS